MSGIKRVNDGNQKTLKIDTTQTKLKHTIIGAGWLSLSSVLSRLLTPISTAILARLLDSYAFGIISIAQIFILAIEYFRGMGIDRALIAYKGDIKKASSTAFYALITTGLISFILLFIVSYFAAYFFKEDILQTVLIIMAIKMIIFSIQAVPQSLLKKQGLWKRYALLDFIQPVLASISTIILALNGLGLWSIIIGSLFGSTIKMVIMFFIYPWRPILFFSFTILKKLISFGKWMIPWSFFTFLMDTMDNSYLAYFKGAIYLGYYTLPFSWITYPMRYILYNITATLFPTLITISDKTEQNKLLLKVLEFIVFIIFPIYIYLIFNASYFVLAIFGNKWIISIEILRWLSLYGIIRSINKLFGVFFISTGRPKLTVAPQFLCLIIISIGFLISWGTWDAVTLTQFLIFALTIRLVLYFIILHMKYNSSITKYLIIILKGIVPAIASSAICYFCLFYLPINLYIKFILSTIIFLIVYLFNYSFIRYKNPIRLFMLSTWKEILSKFK